ncbi:S-layer homology domain-containing protein [Paenibacillus sp. CMAA1364]
MKKVITSMLTVAMSMVMFAGIVGAAPAGFKDVTDKHWAKTAIDEAVTMGYFKGYPDGTFKPNNPVTKTEMAVILSRLENQPNKVGSGNSNFTDIPAWATSGITGAIEKGFINTREYGTKLDATKSLTRGEMAKWFANGLTVVDNDYTLAMTDSQNTVVPAKEYFAKTLPAKDVSGIAVVMGTGLMSVAEDKTIGVTRTTTRAEVATLLSRYSEVATKKATDFKGLTEMREVGKIGTNMFVVAPLEVMRGKLVDGMREDYNVVEEFKPMLNRSIKTMKNNADMKLHNLIVVDPSDVGYQSIYKKVFMDKSVEATSMMNDRFLTFSEQTVNYKGNDKVDSITVANFRNTDRVLDNMSIQHLAPKQYGLTHVGIDMPARNLLKKDVAVRYWGYGDFLKPKLGDTGYNLMVGMTIMTVDGDWMRVGVTKEYRLQ